MELSIDALDLENGRVDVVEVRYPKTHMMSIMVAGVGYIMCGLMNIQALDGLHPEREIIAARFVGVQKTEDLLHFKAAEVTNKARKIGILPGMTGREILNRMLAFRLSGA